MKLKLIKLICILYIYNSIFANTDSLFFSSILQIGELTALIPPTISTNNLPNEVTVSPDGLNVYVSSLGNNGVVSQFSRDIKTGLLSPLNPSTVDSVSGQGGMAISSDGKNVYVTNQGDDLFSEGTLTQFSRNEQTGQLTKIGEPILVGNQPVSIILTSDSENAYIINFGSNTISQFSRNNTTGLLTPLDPVTVQTEYAPGKIIISPDDKNVYVANYISGSLSQYNRSKTTGQLVKVTNAPIEGNSTGIAISGDGLDVYVINTSDTLYHLKRNQNTGELTTIGKYQTLSNSGGIIISPDSLNVYIVSLDYSNNIANISQYNRNIMTGDLTPLIKNIIPVGSAEIGGTTISPDGRNVYLSNYDGDTVLQFSRNLVANY